MRREIKSRDFFFMNSRISFRSSCKFCPRHFCEISLRGSCNAKSDDHVERDRARIQGISRKPRIFRRKMKKKKEEEGKPNDVKAASFITLGLTNLILF